LLTVSSERRTPANNLLDSLHDMGASAHASLDHSVALLLKKAGLSRAE
jgi:hypothetical protein